MKRFHRVVFMFVLLGAPALAQVTTRKQVSPATQVTPAITALAVEISYRKDQATFIPGDKGMWFMNFERLAGWQPPAGFVPVRAVDVASQVENETTLKIDVSVILGPRYHDQVKKVATYSVCENEAVAVAELKEYGIVPVALRVVRTKPVATSPPYVESRTNALELTGIETRDATFPSYIVRLRNVSGKDISALQVYYHTAKGRGNNRPQQPQNQPLIKVGAVFELSAHGGNEGELTADGYAPDALHKVTVATVVFADGTFEGEPLPAAEIKALWQGRKLQLTRALALVEKNLESKDVDDPSTVGRFRRQVEALGEDDGAASVDELAAGFKSLDAGDKLRLRQASGYELHKVKFDLLKDITKFETAHAPSPATGTFRAWLANLKETYEQWLARL